MKMKRYILTVVTGTAALALGSCGDFLEVEPLNDIVQEKFWNEESDVENVVNGCYSALQADAVISRMMVWGEFRSDNLVAGQSIENDKDLSNVMKENITAQNTYTTWKDFYDVINRCNIVLHFAPTVAERDPSFSESEMMATRAEVSALRDLCYFYLIRAFRDVPYTTEPFLDDTQDMALPATPFDEVLASLIADLEDVLPYAVKKYPETNGYAQYGRITQNAIHAMLCDMYLWKRDYANAVKYADLVINAMTADYQDYLDKFGTSTTSSGMIDGFPLIQDVVGNSLGNAASDIFYQGGSQESVLELVYMNNDSYLANTAVGRLYGNATAFPGLVKPADFISLEMKNETFAVFRDKTDLRYYEFVKEASSTLYGIGKYTMGQSYWLSLSGSTVKDDFGTSSLYPADQCRNNWILYRLTDVMLLKAEALVQQVGEPGEGGLAEEDKARLQQALDLVNAIEKRACYSSGFVPLALADYPDKNSMDNLVLLERQKELMFEGKRWFDLVRRSLRDGNSQKLMELVGRKGSESGSASKLANMNALFWPYNIDELKVNARLQQNPAYATSAD